MKIIEGRFFYFIKDGGSIIKNSQPGVACIILLFVFGLFFTKSYGEVENQSDNISLNDEISYKSATLDLDESYVDVDNVIDKLFEHIWNEIQNGTIIKRLGGKNTITLFDYTDSLGESFLIRFNKKPYFRFLIRYKMDSQNPPVDILMSGYFRNRYQSYFFGGNLFLGDTKLRSVGSGSGVLNFKNKRFSINHSQDIFLVDLPQEKNLRMMLLLKESFWLDLNKLDLQNARCGNCDSFMSHQLGVGFVFKDKALLSNIYMGLAGGVNIDLKEGDLYPIISISISLLPAE